MSRPVMVMGDAVSVMLGGMAILWRLTFYIAAVLAVGGQIIVYENGRSWIPWSGGAIYRVSLISMMVGIPWVIFVIYRETIGKHE